MTIIEEVITTGIIFLFFSIFCIWFFIRQGRRLNAKESRQVQKCPCCYYSFYSIYRLVNCCDHKGQKKFTEEENGESSCKNRFFIAS